MGNSRATERRSPEHEGRAPTAAFGTNGTAPSANGSKPSGQNVPMSSVDGVHPILIDERVLIEDFEPATPRHRQSQLARIERCLSDEMPVQLWLYGRPGTGKTLTARRALQRTWGAAGDDYVEVDCWEQDTYHRVLHDIARQLDGASARRTPLEGRGAVIPAREVEEYLAGYPLVVLLDQIDQPCLRERNAIIYSLLQLGNVRLVCVTSGQEAMAELDARVQSRLNPVLVRFPPYSRNEIAAIVADRAKQSLRGDCWRSSTVERIAKLAEGDVRLAVRMLREAACLADRQRSPSIQPKHVSAVAKLLWRETPQVRLRQLTTHHRLLYRLVPRRRRLTTTRLRQDYLEACQAKRLTPIAQRTYTKYLRRLIRARLLVVRRAPGKDNLRLISRASQQGEGDDHE